LRLAAHACQTAWGSSLPSTGLPVDVVVVVDLDGDGDGDEAG
jgi:hypothetical protein